MREYTSVGKIRKAHGIRGELYLISFSKTFDWMEDLGKNIFLLRKEQDSEGKLVEKLYEYPLKKAKAHKIGMILKVEGIETRNQAEELEGALFQVPTEILDNVAEEEFYLLKLKGFKVVNEQGDAVASITGFSTNNSQDLLEVEAGPKEYQIPYVEDWVLNIDFENQKIQMKLPEGLLEE